MRMRRQVSFVKQFPFCESDVIRCAIYLGLYRILPERILIRIFIVERPEEECTQNLHLGTHRIAPTHCRRSGIIHFLTYTFISSKHSPHNLIMPHPCLRSPVPLHKQFKDFGYRHICNLLFFRRLEYWRIHIHIHGSHKRKRSHKGCNPDIPVLDLIIVTVKLKFTVSHICGFIMLTRS